jgi:DNA-binding CsgD family transcriptional regulator
VHPLLAEVLEEGLLPEERRALHAAFATALERSSGRDENTDVDGAVDLADHHHRAGHAEQAYRWALRGAAAAERAGGATENLRLLRRALDLRPKVPAAELSERDLLQRIRYAAERAGEHEDELSAIEELLAAVDRKRDPLWTTELLVRRMHLRFMTGWEFFPVADMAEAVRLSAASPDSAEYALAMAELADAELWQGVPTAAAHARQAVRLARACGSDRALTYALVASVMARWLVDVGGNDRDDPKYAAACVADAEEAQAAAARQRDFFGFVHATLWAGNSIDCNISRPSIEYSRRGREAMTLLGAPHAYVAWLCAIEASGLMMLGDWRACVDRLRVALGATPGPLGDMYARLTAALLACWQGRPTEAEAHLARAEELVAEQSGFLVSTFDAVRAELAVAGGDLERAMTAALAGLRSETPPTFVERLVPLAARALADEAQRSRDRGADPAPAVARLDGLRRHYPTVAQDFGGVLGLYADQVRAMQALYDAEMCRGTLDPDTGVAWLRAVVACHDGQLAWDEAYAQWRVAEALLPDRSARAAAVAALRRAHELAVELEAAPLLAEVEALAGGAHVTLTVVPAGVPIRPAALSGLTPREREVLGHVVAGRTYREIARALVVSEKTVSVHISNMLHKTGTANRIELAQLVRRLSGPTADG